jgi:regulatory protein
MAEEILYKTALSKAMAICSRREYCTGDIRSKIESWGIGEKDADRIISTLISENFINEWRYAQAFVKDKFHYNRWGKVKIAAHLKAKRISGDLVRRALECIDDELYLKTMKETVLSHRRSVKAKNQFDLKGKLLRYGLSKGFESSLLYEFLNSPED